MQGVEFSGITEQELVGEKLWRYGGPKYMPEKDNYEDNTLTKATEDPTAAALECITWSSLEPGYRI